MIGQGIAKSGATAERDAAFRRLADQHLESSYRLACAILRNPTEAQDATHDAFVQAWRRWSTLRDPARFEAWFHRIVVNTCRNRLKRAARWRIHDLSDDIPNPGRDPLVHTLERDALGAAIATLSPDHQVVVALRFYRDLTVEDIASHLGIPAGTVNSRLHYAMKYLEAALRDAEREGALR